MKELSWEHDCVIALIGVHPVLSYCICCEPELHSSTNNCIATYFIINFSVIIVIFTAVGRGDATDWEFDIYLMNDKIFHFSFTEVTNPRVSQSIIIICVLQQYSIYSYHQQVEVSHNTETKSVHLLFSERKPLVVADDVRMIFYCSTVSLSIGYNLNLCNISLAYFPCTQKSIPTGNDKCQFNIWFNTTFIDNKRYDDIIMLK